MGTMIIIIIIYYVREAEKQTVKLIKWYKTLVNEIDFDKNGNGGKTFRQRSYKYGGLYNTEIRKKIPKKRKIEKF